MTARKVAAKPAPATRSLLVFTNTGMFRVQQVPANAKVTFSRLNPQQQPGYGTNDACLRIYTTESNQLAVFTGVTSFRDESLLVLERVRNKDRKTRDQVQHTVDGTTVYDSEDTTIVNEEWREVAF